MSVLFCNPLHAIADDLHFSVTGPNSKRRAGVISGVTIGSASAVILVVLGVHIYYRKSRGKPIVPHRSGIIRRSFTTVDPYIMTSSDNPPPNDPSSTFTPVVIQQLKSREILLYPTAPEQPGSSLPSEGRDLSIIDDGASQDIRSIPDPDQLSTPALLRILQARIRSDERYVGGTGTRFGSEPGQDVGSPPSYVSRSVHTVM